LQIEAEIFRGHRLAVRVYVIVPDNVGGNACNLQDAIGFLKSNHIPNAYYTAFRT
jgi:hypothetical protein